MAPETEHAKIKIGISTCLLGRKVRYDGNHSHDRYLTQTLGMFTEYVPVCPEVECGMPTPREAVRLRGNPESPRLITQKTGIDKTAMMETWIPGKLAELEKKISAALFSGANRRLPAFTASGFTVMTAR